MSARRFCRISFAKNARLTLASGEETNEESSWPWFQIQQLE